MIIELDTANLLAAALDDGADHALAAIVTPLLEAKLEQLAPWWRTAKKPPCPDWCVIEHEVDELACGGTIGHYGAGLPDGGGGPAARLIGLGRGRSARVGLRRTTSSR